MSTFHYIKKFPLIAVIVAVGYCYDHFLPILVKIMAFILKNQCYDQRLPFSRKIHIILTAGVNVIIEKNIFAENLEKNGDFV
jgi:hypothetical protein